MRIKASPAITVSGERASVVIVNSWDAGGRVHTSSAHMTSAPSPLQKSRVTLDSKPMPASVDHHFTVSIALRGRTLSTRCHRNVSGGVTADFFLMRADAIFLAL